MDMSYGGDGISYRYMGNAIDICQHFARIRKMKKLNVILREKKDQVNIFRW